MADEEPTYKFASAMAKGLPAVDPATAETVTPFEWDESDGSHHTGSEYHFPPETGLPYLRTEWYPRTDGISYGIGFLFMATATPATGGGPSDYSFAEAEDHPDNEQHYRDVLYEPFNALFPDLASVDIDGTTVTIDDAVAEMVRRYRAWLANIHPSPVASLQQAAVDVTQQMIALAQSHIEIHNALKAEDPDAHVPGLDPALVAQVAAADPTLLDNTVE